jgi:hypothetical protein
MEESAQPRDPQVRPLNYLCMVGAFGLCLAAVLAVTYLNDPQRGKVSYVPVEIFYVIYGAGFILVDMALFSIPLSLFAVVSESSRFVAFALYYAIYAVAAVMVCGLYTPWVPRVRFVPASETIGEIMGLSTTLYGVMSLWWLARPSPARAWITAAVGVPVILLVFKAAGATG